MKCYTLGEDGEPEYYESKAITVADIIKYLKKLPQTYEVGCDGTDYGFIRPFDLQEDIVVDHVGKVILV